jgi:chaperonin GroEL
MAAKEVKFSVYARDSMLRGIDILAHAVRVTCVCHNTVSPD